MKSENYLKEKELGIEKMRLRYNLLNASLEAYKGNEYLTPLPFNSGYFMAFICKGDAEELRLYLLEKYEVGTISIKNQFLRLAFSSTDLNDIEDLLRIVYQAASEIF